MTASRSSYPVHKGVLSATLIVPAVASRALLSVSRRSCIALSEAARPCCVQSRCVFSPFDFGESSKSSLFLFVPARLKGHSTLGEQSV